MHAYADAQLLEIWEQGLVQHPVDRALSLLLAAGAGDSRASLAALTIGQRDALLLQAYRHSVGGHLESTAHCPACGSQMEFQLDATRLVQESTHEPVAGLTTRIDGYELSLRPPTSFDLAAAAASPDVESARRVLLERCILNATLAGTPISPHELPARILDEVDERLSTCDPLAEILIDLTCTECGNTWQELLDVSAFLWAHVNAEARRLLIQVHTLASAYGWSEAEILALHPLRRKAYLELAG